MDTVPTVSSFLAMVLKYHSSCAVYVFSWTMVLVSTCLHDNNRKL